MKKDGTLATITNDEGYLPLWGILNAQGSFWTARTFENAQDAENFIWGFWGNNTTARESCLRTHKIVPVHVVITEIASAAGGRSPETPQEAQPGGRQSGDADGSATPKHSQDTQ